MYQIVLRWFGRVESMDVRRIPRRESMAGVSGWRVRSRKTLGLMEGAKVTLGSREMAV